ncbi:hypothetical protein LDENG_00003600 [Lucifuga dentata]|nr:hypothetical protein LDENG_00003600 [Lucifuga dentata]
MPPKTKRTKKKAAKGKTAVVDGMSTEEMSKEQLEEHINRLREELDREREEKSYFQLERDKIHSFWEISKRSLQETKAELRTRQREREEDEARHRAEITVYKQKLKHVLSEHHDTITELKVNGVIASTLIQEENAQSEHQRRTEMHKLNLDLRHNEFCNENTIKEFKLKHEEDLSETRKYFMCRVREIELKFKKKKEALMKEEDRRKRTEMDELEARLNKLIKALMQKHEKAQRELALQFGKIHNDCETDFKTPEDIRADVKKQQKHVEKELAAAMREEKCLTERARGRKPEYPEGTHVSRAGVKLRTHKDRELQVEIELLLQAFQKVERERDELLKKQKEVLLQLQQKSSLKELLVETQLGALTEVLEKKEAQLCATLSASNVDQAAHSGAANKLQCARNHQIYEADYYNIYRAHACSSNDKLGVALRTNVTFTASPLRLREDILESKTVTIKQLQDEIAQACQAYNALLQSSKEKLRDLNLPVEDLRLQPIECLVAGKSPQFKD